MTNKEKFGLSLMATSILIGVIDAPLSAIKYGLIILIFLVGVMFFGWDQHKAQ